MTKNNTTEIFDCFDGCEECTVCKYLNFREWAEGCAPSGSTIERNEMVEDYLNRKAQARLQERKDTLESVREKIRNMPKKNLGTNQYEEKYVRWNSFGREQCVDDLLALEANPTQDE